MKYKIQMLFTYGWDDECEEPEIFDTKDAAERSIKANLESVADAVALGYMEEEYDPEDYRIVEVTE
jgi:hypothetical protein